MKPSTTFVPVAGSDGADMYYAERASDGRGLYAVVQDLLPGSHGSRHGFVRAAFREIVARYQSPARPQAPASYLRGVVRVLDETARRVESRVDDFRGLGVFVLVGEPHRLHLLCRRDVPARVRTGGLVLPVGKGVAGAAEMAVETTRAQHDLFAQSLSDSLALYVFDAGALVDTTEFFLGGGDEDIAAVMDALEVKRDPGARVSLERSSRAVVHLACDRPETPCERPHGERTATGSQRAAPERAAVLTVAAAAVLVAVFAWLRWGAPGGGAESTGQQAAATRERAPLQDVRTEAAPVEQPAAPSAEEVRAERVRGFSQAWQQSYSDAVTSSPAAIGGAVVFGARDGKVYALDGASGGTTWTHRASGGVGASPIVAGDAVFACDYGGNVYRLARADGRVVWRRVLKEKIVSTPATTDERVLVGTVAGKVYALSRDTGRVLWTFRTRGQIRGSIAASGGTVFVPSHDGRLYALADATGARRWSVPLGGPAASSPAVEGDRVFIGSPRGSVAAFDVATGARKWSYATGGAVNSALLAAAGRVYAGSGDRHLYCLDASDGALVWKHATGGVILSRPALSGERVVVTSYDGAVYCLDAATGRLEGRFDTPEPIFSSPLVLGDRVYFGNNGGRFYGLELPQ